MATELKKQVEDFAKAKLDSSKMVLKDTLQAVKTDLLKAAQQEVLKKIGGKSDSTVAESTDPKKRIEEAGKGIINGLFKKKKAAADTTSGG